MSEKAKEEKKPQKEKKPKKEKAVKMKVCPSCQAEIPQKAKLCPHCAAEQKGKSPLPVILAVVVPLLILAAGAVSVFVFHFPVDPPFDLPFGKQVNETPLGTAMELSGKQEEAVTAVFEQCGIFKITDAKKLRLCSQRCGDFPVLGHKGRHHCPDQRQNQGGGLH